MHEPRSRKINWCPHPRVRPGVHLKSDKLPHQKPLVAEQSFEAVALMVAERIDVKSINDFEVIAKSPYLVRLGTGGLVAIFRYGVVVFFDTPREQMEEFLHSISRYLSGAGDPGADEHVQIHIEHVSEEGPVGKALKIKSADRLRLQLIAEVMSKASLLSSQERRALNDFERSEPLAQDLAEDGKFSANSSELLKAVGSMLLTEGRLNGRAGVLDRPDLLWDNPGLAGLYARLEGDYELQDRAAALERKLATLAHTSETLVETMRYHSSHRLEFFIFVLIFVELCVAVTSHFR